MKLIKRYANRRLYDSDTSKTITLDEIAEYLRSGEEIKVVDNISGEDITSKVLGQTFLRIQEPKGNEPLVNYILTALIRESGGGFVNLVKKLAFAGIGMAGMPAKDRESLFNAIVQLDNISEQNHNVLESLASQGQQEADKIVQSVRTKFDEVTKHVQGSLLAALDPNSRKKKIQELTKQVEELTAKVEQLQGNEVRTE